jgi:hypothetical protein
MPDWLLVEAAELWSDLDVAETGADLALALIRKAYGQGYVDALTDAVSEEIPA